MRKLLGTAILLMFFGTLLSTAQEENSPNVRVFIFEDSMFLYVMEDGVDLQNIEFISDINSTPYEITTFFPILRRGGAGKR